VLNPLCAFAPLWGKKGNMGDYFIRKRRVQSTSFSGMCLPAFFLCPLQPIAISGAMPVPFIGILK
jgi:hypothetical protein